MTNGSGFSSNNMPAQLLAVLNEKKNRWRTVSHICMGGDENRYWFVAFADGYYEHILPTVIREGIQDIEKHSHVRSVYFTYTEPFYYTGEVCDFIIRYSFR